MRSNYDIAKGIVGILFGAHFFFNGAGLLCLLTYDDMSPKSTLPSPSVIVQPTKGFLATRSLAIPVLGIFTIFSLWILKISSTSFYKGWYKKENALKNLAKIDELLALLEDIKSERAK